MPVTSSLASFGLPFFLAADYNDSVTINFHYIDFLGWILMVTKKKAFYKALS